MAVCGPLVRHPRPAFAAAVDHGSQRSLTGRGDSRSCTFATAPSCLGSGHVLTRLAVASVTPKAPDRLPSTLRTVTMSRFLVFHAEWSHRRIRCSTCSVRRSATRSSGSDARPTRYRSTSTVCIGSDALREPGTGTNRAPVAQWIEHLTSDQRVGGSNPSGRATVLSRDIGDT